MIFDSHCYKTRGSVRISRSISNVLMDASTEEILLCLNSQPGGWLASSYEYPGQCTQWKTGFTNLPLEIVKSENYFASTSDEQSIVAPPYLVELLKKKSQFQGITLEKHFIISSKIGRKIIFRTRAKQATGIEHKTLPTAAVQFQSESIMSQAYEVSLAIIRNTEARNSSHPILVTQNL